MRRFEVCLSVAGKEMRQTVSDVGDVLVAPRLLREHGVARKRATHIDQANVTDLAISMRELGSNLLGREFRADN